MTGITLYALPNAVGYIESPCRKGSLMPVEIPLAAA